MAESNDELFYVAKTMTDVHRAFKIILNHLDVYYWIDNCGFDSLSFILY